MNTNTRLCFKEAHFFVCRYYQSSKSSGLSSNLQPTGAKADHLREEMEEAANRMEICRVSHHKPTVALFYNVSFKRNLRMNQCMQSRSHQCCLLMAPSSSVRLLMCVVFLIRISCQQICTVLWPKKLTMQATSRRWAPHFSGLGLFWMESKNIPLLH